MMEPAARKKNFPWIVYAIVLALILMMASAPIGGLVLAGVIANANGCQLDEGSSHPCIIGGTDYGDTLYTLGVLGWMMLLTLPAGAVAGIVWLVVLLVHRSGWKERRRAVSDAAESRG